MNSKLVKASLAGAAVIALAAGGGTFAAWSDFGQVNSNETDAGHLKLNLGATGVISNVGGLSIAPGQNRTIDQYLTSADLDGVPSADLSVTFSHLVNNENGCSTNSETAVDPTCATVGDPGEFAQEGYIRVRYSNPEPVANISWDGSNCIPSGGYLNSIDYTPASDNNTTHYPRLGTFAAEGAHALGTLTGGQGICVRMDIGLDPNADDKVQGDSSTWDMQYDLKQHL
jgi:alternate signal-mediated exported protein